MPPSPPTQQMGDKHEEYLAQVNGGARNRASGSQWAHQADGLNNHDDPFAFRWDGKSTLGKSISVTREMLAKIRDQAHGERPQIGLRFYGNPNLDDVDEDWIAVPGQDWEEVLTAARRWAEHEAHPPMIISGQPGAVPVPVPASLEHLMGRAGEADNLRKALADAHKSLLEAGETIARQRLELEGNAAGQPPQARFLPRLPWTVVHTHAPGIPLAQVMVRYSADGYQTAVDAASVRVERTPGNRPRLMVNDQIVRDGDLYKDGKLAVRVCHDDPSIEVG